MMATRFSRITLLVLMGLVILGVLNAFAATNTIPAKRLDDDSISISANNLKPPECSSLNLTSIVVAGNGTTGNDLILGTAGDDTLNGDDGDDCIVGGGGNDTLQGQKGNDIVLGQDGDDNLRGNQDTDICDGGPGTDSGHPSCETEINIP
jgi:Ca2+-binding RTX toxin-like protein